MGISPRWRPCVICGVGGDALKALSSQLVGHPISKLGITCNDLPGNVRFDWFHVRGKEEARSESALLMDVVHNLRVPLVMNVIDGELSLNLRKGVPVAIVIVTRVLVVELRRIGAFIWCPERFVIPVFYDVYAVWI